MAKVRLDFRKVFRKVGRADLEALASDVAALPRPKAGGRAGGEIVAKIRKLKPRVRVWGYVLNLASLRQAFWWLLNGASRPASKQEARPVPDRRAEFSRMALDEMSVSAAEQLSAVDRSVVA